MMNDKIRELVILAKLDDPNFPIEDWDNVPLAKFAELIVNECLMTIAMHDLVPGHSAFSEMIYERQVELLRDVCEEIKEHLCKNP